MTVPADLQPNFMTECLTTFFGFPMARTFTVGHQTPPAQSFSIGARDQTSFSWHFWETVSYTSMLDAEGRPFEGVSLDAFELAVLLLFRWWFDCRRGSPGRRLVGIRLVDPSATELAPPNGSACARRYGWFALGLAPFWIPALTIPFFDPADRGTFFLVLGGVLAIASTFAILSAVASIVRRREAFYDRLAGTMVIRVVGQGRGNHASVPA